MTSKVARRYAKAVFENLKGSPETATVADELEAFGKMISANREARIVLVFGLVPAEKKREIVQDLAKKMKLGETTQKVLVVLAEAGRLSELLAIADRLRALLSVQSGVLLLNVRTAEPVNAETRAAVEKKFEQILKSKVEARYQVDPRVLGGLHVHAAGRTFDGSVAGMLSEVAEHLVQGGSP